MATAAGPLIYAARVAPDDDRIKIYPGEFLGGERFTAYRRTCQAGGAAFVPALNANTIRLEHLPALKVALENSGFTVKISAEIGTLAAIKAHRIESEVQAAAQRLEHPAAAQLFPFQVEGVRWLAPRAAALLADEMGLGKTPTALLAAPAAAPLLIVCPASLKGMWLAAVPRWRPDLKARIIDRFEWPAPSEALIINYERLPIPPDELAAGVAMKKSDVALEALTELAGIPPGLVVIADECHYLKSGKSRRSKRFRALGRAVRKSGGRTHGLTGTPMPNRPQDLLAVLQAFDLLKDSFGTYPNFIKLMNGKQDYWGKWLWGEARPEAAPALQRVMLRRRRLDVMPDLPDAIFEDVVIDLKDLPRAAAQANAEAVAAMAAAGVSIQDIIAGRASGAATDSVFRARRILAEALTPHAIEILESYQESAEPIIIFSAHVAPIEALGRLARVGLIDGSVPAEKRQGVAEAFQAGQLDAIAATIKTAAVGFTLTRAAHVLLIDEEWTPDWNQQAVARVLRIGQTRGVLVKRFIVPGTVYEDVRAINDGKLANIAASVDRAAVKSVKDTTVEDLRRIGENL